jgi:hypothetical protein
MPFDPLTRELLDKTRTVEIETSSPKGTVHRVPIWVVVDGDDVFVRSVRGSRARWYRELLARPGAVVTRSRRIPVRAASASDPSSKRRMTLGLRRKYPTSGASLVAMVRPEVLDTTLRLEPNGARA